MQHKFVFVSGCPRSGTTVLTHILNWADSSFIGQERFAGLLNRQPDAFVPAIFSSERLARFEKGDCGYQGFDGLREYSAKYARAKDFAALGESRFIGDKAPKMYKALGVFGSPAWAGEEVTVLHIVRNALDVAASYQSRLLNPKDNWDKTYEQAITDWTESVESVHAYLGAPRPNVRLGIVDYDSVFSGDFDCLLDAAKKIYAFTGMAFGPEQEAGMEKIFTAGEQRRTLRQSHDDIRDDVARRIGAEVLAKHAELAARAVA